MGSIKCFSKFKGICKGLVMSMVFVRRVLDTVLTPTKRFQHTGGACYCFMWGLIRNLVAHHLDPMATSYDRHFLDLVGSKIQLATASGTGLGERCL